LLSALLMNLLLSLAPKGMNCPSETLLEFSARDTAVLKSYSTSSTFPRDFNAFASVAANTAELGRSVTNSCDASAAPLMSSFLDSSCVSDTAFVRRVCNSWAYRPLMSKAQMSHVTS
jgi:hypothetical protein